MNKILKRRKEKSLSRKELAEKVGVTPESIRHYEQNIREPKASIKKSSTMELKENEAVMCYGDGLISKGFEREILRDEDKKGYVRVKFDVEWCGFFIKKDFRKIMDDALNQINDFLFSDEDRE